jgi:DNA polymerase epsilon subunit 2|tara:strand:- start:926 stop:1429 length:504 start_codon:yes stop_codon:yes gene_type:complete
MITQVEENKYYLEDLTGRIPLNLGNITCDGFVTENCIVLVEGEVVDGVFTCVRMGMPPYEMRSNAIDALGLQTADIFSSIGNRTQLKLLQEQEEDAIDSMFVILSDVHLDKPLVIEKLKDLFEGYQVRKRITKRSGIHTFATHTRLHYSTTPHCRSSSSWVTSPPCQ